MLNILDMAGIPILSEDRDDQLPLVLAGGPCAYNPEPLAKFIDAFVIGDGEEVIIEIARFVHDAKRRGGSKIDILHQLAQFQGVYVPSFYDIQNSQQLMIKPNREDVPETIIARTIEKLEPGFYPQKPLVPLIETTHDRYSVEIMRGCTQGCRFCNAGIIYRPVRERPVDELVTHVTTVIQNTGYDEISLASLSTSDYSQLNALLSRLNSVLEPLMVNVSFPSLRTETFSAEMAKYASKVRKSGLTLAPEAGTERLRNIINKTNSNADLLRAIKIVFDEGWEKIKLYFMIGQPGETREDLDGIVSLVREIVKIARQNRGKSVHISISPFCPKPHTPFQWVEQNSVKEMNEKVFYLKDRLSSNKIKFNWREPEIAFLEGIIARGDRKVGDIIFKAWELGAKFDAWSDQFNFGLWQQAFQYYQIDPEMYNRRREIDEQLPWDFIAKGVSKDYLKKEFHWSQEGRPTPDCRQAVCHACGMMSQPVCQDILYQKKEKKLAEETAFSNREESGINFGRSRKRIKTVAEPSVRAMRIKYEKRNPIRFTSHLDLIRIFERAFRRAGIKLVYSRGFHPHPRISFGPPLAVGFTSDAEYFDFQYYRDKDHDIKAALNRMLPEGLKILETRNLYGKHQSLASIINRAEYKVVLYRAFDQSYLNQSIAEFMERNQIIIKRKRGADEQDFDIRAYVESIDADAKKNDLHVSLHIINGRTARVPEILGEMLSLSGEEITLSRVNRLNLLIQFGDVKATPLDV